MSLLVAASRATIVLAVVTIIESGPAARAIPAFPGAESFGSSGPADRRVLVADPNSIFNTPTVPRPAYLQPIIDPVFRTRITRITGDPGRTQGGVTWGDRARHHSSHDQAWNADQSLLLIFNNGTPDDLLLDGETYEFKSALDFRHDEIRWHPQEPHLLIYTRGNQLKAYNLKTNTHETLHEFTEYADTRYALKLGPWAGNLSNDGKWIAFIARARSGEYEAFAYDIEKDNKHRPLELGRHGPDDKTLDWVSMSASGQYAVVHWTDTNTKVYDRNMNLVGKLPENISHFDLAVDVDGEDVAVGVSKPGKYDGSLIKLRLTDGHMTRLTFKGYAGHTSTRNLRRRGWAYVTYQTRSRNWPPFFDEVVAVKMDGSGQVERLARMHALETDYRTEAQASPSPDGKRVVFASTWDSASGRPIGCYVIDTRHPAASHE